MTTPPAHGSVTGRAPRLTYTAASGFAGTDSIGFQVSDGRGGTDAGAITLNVFAGVVLDQTPPTITLGAPTNGAVYQPTDTVPAAFDCADTTTAVRSCTGTVATGSPVAMSVGLHTFAVQATDSQGNQARQLVSYRVIDPTPVVQHYEGSATDTLGIACDSQLPPTPTTLPLVVSAPTQVPPGGASTSSPRSGSSRCRHCCHGPG